jgi:hypothetical protein
MDNKEEKLKKLLFDIINKLSKDADVYHHNGSLWLIHTENRKWIVEFTRERTLWFNYNFFRSAFKFVSLDINDKNEFVDIEGNRVDENGDPIVEYSPFLKDGQPV